jgi:hypothetical protein
MKHFGIFFLLLFQLVFNYRTSGQSVIDGSNQEANTYGGEIQRIDSLGRKQGHWLIYGYFNSPCSKKLLKDSALITEGQYLNGQKIGTWNYRHCNYSPCDTTEQHIDCYTYKSEFYSPTLVIIDYFGQYYLSINPDTSYISAIIYSKEQMNYCATCKKEISDSITTCYLYGGKNNEFIRKKYSFRKSKDVMEFIEKGCIGIY